MSPSPCFFLSPQNATLVVRALEALGDGLLFVDLKGRRFWANDAFYGLIHEEPLRDEAPLDLWLNGLEEGDRSALESDLSRSGEPFQREFRLLRSDKTPVWLKVRGTTAAFDEKRTSGGSLLVVSDISRRKTAEDRILRGERRFRTLFEAARDGVILCDFEGTILDVNPSVCSALGRNPFELYHKNLSAFLPMAEGETLKAILETVRNEGDGLFETAFIDAGGEERPVEISARRT
ncbi:MAG: PAS domain-containing protein, partial [Synergistales bacterium]|nr:PAS domain-containing protein [Synergistales bacterium]